MPANDIALAPKQVKSIFECRHHRINIWSGAVRSGKTISACFAFFEAVASVPANSRILVAGRTLQTIERNVIEPMQDPAVFGELAKHVVHTRGSSVAQVCGKTVHLIGANDARSEGKLRGVTAALAMIDEATLVPEAFFTQMLARLSVPGARLLCTTNPDAPAHWLKAKYLDRADELGLGKWHFLMRDNPTLADDYIDALEAEYTGLWYRRFILGEWVSAEGAVYDMWDTHAHVVSRDQMPAMSRILGLGVDYGTTNPTAGILLGLGEDRRLYVVGEWAPRRGSTDSELADQLRGWLDVNPSPEYVFLDPSAASFRAELYYRYGSTLPVDKANNDVIDGIRSVASLLASDRLRVVDTATNLIGEMGGYRWDDKASERGEDKPVKADDHYCFVAGTMIATADGEVPVELVGPGDLVWTRHGLRPVEAVDDHDADTVVLTTFNGTKLQGTPDHPLHTAEGWTPLGELAPGDMLHIWPDWLPDPGTLTRDAQPMVGVDRVLEVATGTRETVYTLKVTDVPEYFANGVLVHNCDALRYSVHSSARFWQRLLQQEPL